MTKRILLLTALLASTAAVGSAFAAGHFARFGGDPVAAITGAFDDDRGEILLASGDDRRRGERHARHGRHDDAEHHGRRDRDDDDDDDHHGRGRDGRRGSALAPTGPSDPAAPVPQNGLFRGKSRPKVEVQ